MIDPESTYTLGYYVVIFFVSMAGGFDVLGIIISVHEKGEEMKRRGFIKAVLAGGAGAVAVAVTPMAEAERVVEEATAATGPPSKLATDALAMAAITPHVYRPQKKFCVPLDLHHPDFGVKVFPVFFDHDGWYMCEASPYAVEHGIHGDPCWWGNIPEVKKDLE